MAGVETAGLILGSIPLLISIPESYSQLRDYRLVAREKELGRIKEYGLITTIFLHTLFRDAFFVMEKVEQFVIHAEDQKVMAFIKSYTANFNMIGVAVRLCVDESSRRGLQSNRVLSLLRLL